MKRFAAKALLCIGCCVGGALVQAAEMAPGVQSISAPEVKMMMTEENPVLVHVLSSIEYEIQHIPGSINIPITEMATTERLPEDKRRPVVFYCMGHR
jgi:rhodanese-related sulfurtransferase